MRLSGLALFSLLLSTVSAYAQIAPGPPPTSTYCSNSSGSGWVPCPPPIGNTSTPDVTSPQPPATATASSGPLMCQQGTASATLVCKASAGNLYGVQATVQASTVAFWVLVFNATAAPVDGAVTPSKCFYVPANSTGTLSFPVFGPYFSAGITFSASSTGCFTKTAVTANFPFLSGDYR